MRITDTDLRDLLKSFPAEVGELALATRAMIQATIPGIEETVDTSARIAGYGFGAGYVGVICTIILSKGGVKLGLVNGATLADPKRLLAGEGKRHRYVALAKPSDLRKPGLRALLKAGHASWKKR